MRLKAFDMTTAMVCDSTDCVEDVGEHAAAYRPHLHGHHMHLLSRRVFRLVGLAV